MEKATKAIYAGIDTHKDLHFLCIIDNQGTIVFEGSFKADAKSYKAVSDRLLCTGECKRIAIEACGSYGKGIACYLLAQGFDVREALAPGKMVWSPNAGKSDKLDAQAAAKLAMFDQCPHKPKATDGQVESLRLLLKARECAVKSQTAITNTIKGLLISAKSSLKERFENLEGKALMQAILACKLKGFDEALWALKSLARRWKANSTEIEELECHIAAIVNRYYAPLASAFGIGSINAATLIVSVGSDPHRFGSEAAFAKALGVCPIPVSSGKSERMRINKGGDRAGNHALHQIAIVRYGKDPRTKAYVAKKRSEGKSKRDAIRCLKRYIAKEVYRLLLLCYQSTPSSNEALALQRKSLGLKQAEVAKMLGIGTSKLSFLERNKIRNLELEQQYQKLLNDFEKI